MYVDVMDRVDNLRAKATRLEAFFERRATIYTTVGQAARARSYLLAAAHLEMLGRCFGCVDRFPNGTAGLVSRVVAAVDDALPDAGQVDDDPAAFLALRLALDGAAEASDGLSQASDLPLEAATAPRHLRGLVRALAAMSESG